MLIFFDNLCTASDAFTPSTTCMVFDSNSDKLLPSASARPNLLFLERLLVQVKKRSPAPDKPEKVSFFAPKATPSFWISCNPLVISAILAFSP